MKQKRIVIFGGHPKYVPNVEGPAVYCGNLSELLANKIKVILLTPGQKHQQISKGKLVIIKMGGNPKKRRSFKYYKFAWKLRKKYDISHIMDSKTGFGFLFLNLFIRKPMVITLHGYIEELIINHNFKKNSIHFKTLCWMEKKVLQKANAIIAVGKTLRNWIIYEYGINPDKIFYIPNGVDAKKFKLNLSARENLRKKLNIEQNRKIILYSKKLNNQNGILNLLEAMTIISKKYPDVLLLILGDGALKKAVINYQKNKLPKNILYLGRVPYNQMSDYMSLADIFILPSSPLFEFGKYKAGEVSPLTLREAMACELPVVATDVGGNTEIIKDGKKHMKDDVSLLIPSNQPKDIANGVISLLNNPEKRKNMGEKARIFIENYYTWEEAAKKVLQVYDYSAKK